MTECSKKVEQEYRNAGTHDMNIAKSRNTGESRKERAGTRMDVERIRPRDQAVQCNGRRDEESRESRKSRFDPPRKSVDSQAAQKRS